MKQEQSEKTSYQAVSLAVYIITVVVASALLIIEPNNFDARAMVLPVIILLTVGSVGMAQRFAVNENSRLLTVLGTVALAAVFVTIGFYIVYGVGSLVGAWPVSR